MGFKDSKSVRILKEYGIKPFMSHCLHKSIKSLNRRSIFVLLQFYPKIVLNKSQLKTFKLVYQHFEENYRNIIAISPSFFIKNLKKHIAWLESQSFKNRYGGVGYLADIHVKTINGDIKAQCGGTHRDAIAPSSYIDFCHAHNNNINTHEDDKQFYPPLLNPEEVNYEDICADLALELRLPPPPHKFVLIRYGLSGGLAMANFLQKNGIHECDYRQLFATDSQHSKYACLYVDHLWTPDNDRIKKSLYTIKENDKILVTTRDPISRLKSMINHGYYLREEMRHKDTFTIFDDPYHVVNRKGYHNEHYEIDSNTPFITNNLLRHWAFTCSFAYYSNLSFLSKRSDITYLDIQEIMPDKVFETMLQLAKKFDFALPKKEHKGFYEEIKWGIISILLPLTCLLCVSNGREVKIYVTGKYEADMLLLNVDKLLLDNEHPLLDQVAFSMSEDDLKALQDDKETLGKVKAYMVRFLDELKKRIDYIQRNNKHENDVLEIFRGDRELCREFKTMLDKELIHIKAHRPDIIASWKYYQEFERICAEEHGIN